MINMWPRIELLETQNKKTIICYGVQLKLFIEIIVKNQIVNFYANRFQNDLIEKLWTLTKAFKMQKRYVCNRFWICYRLLWIIFLLFDENSLTLGIHCTYFGRKLVRSSISVRHSIKLLRLVKSYSIHRLKWEEIANL